MRKTKKLVVLSLVLVALCLAVFFVSRSEERREQIKASGEVFLSVPADEVTALSWENEDGSFSFTRGEDGWVYDGDENFPVDDERVEEMLSLFEGFSAAFVIDEVESFGDYGLDDPVCTVSLSAGETQYTVSLGDLSKMDEQRYVSVGDGKAYLVTRDPLDLFSAVLEDMILNDEVPLFDTLVKLKFSGSESYIITRDEEFDSLCADDVYFAGMQPLDTDRVDDYATVVASLDLDEYVSYHVTDEDLSAFGLDEPELSVTVGGSYQGELCFFTVHIGRDQAQLLAAQEAGDDESAVDAYVRLDDSQIVYRLDSGDYTALMAAGYDDLRHQEIFTADFDAVQSIDLTLDGEAYRFERGEDGVWLRDGNEVELDDVSSALLAVKATEFVETQPSGKLELSLTFALDIDAFPTLSVSFYRVDGESCLAMLDGESVALVARSRVVALVESLNALVLS